MSGTAASWLFVPGDRPDRFDKAVAAGADEVIIDLEDAVAPADKVTARNAAVDWLATGSAWVRVNAAGTPWHEDDVRTLATARGLRGLVVPKAEDVEALEAVRRELLGRPIVALVETALGLARAIDIARCPGVERLAFGSIDFALDIGSSEDDTALLLARSTLVVGSRVAGKAAPIDGVTTALTDPDAVRRDAERARGLGFGGKLCIHPTQVAVVGAAFRPTPEQVAWARQVLDDASSGAGVVASSTGQLIDKPVLDRARRILDQTDQTHQTEQA